MREILMLNLFLQRKALPKETKENFLKKKVLSKKNTAKKEKDIKWKE